MTIEQHDERQKFIVIVTAFIIHLLLCSSLFFTNFQPPTGDIIYFSAADQPAEVPVIFQDPDMHNTPADQQWAAMTARASQFGNPDDEMSAGFTQDESVNSHSNESASSDEEGEDGDQDTSSSVSGEYQPPTAIRDSTPGLQPMIDSSALSVSQRKKGGLTKTQKKAAQQLAVFTKGYLEQIGTNGNNIVSLVGGDPTKRPTAEQLKYERYWAKIQWCLQNSFKINYDRFVPTRSIHCIMKIFFSVDRQGRMHDLHIVQSSGNRTLDNFMHYAFDYAAGSLPPLPSFIKDPYPMTWVVDVAIDAQPRWGVALD